MTEQKTESGTSLFINVQKSISERMNDPVISTFSISFIIWNWRFFFVLFFSKGDAGQRLSEAYNCYLSTHFTADCYIMPLGITILYLFGWNWFLKCPIYWIEKLKTKQENEKKRAQGENLLTKEESVEFKSKVELYEKVIIDKYIELYPSMEKENFKFYYKISNKNPPFFGCIYKDEIRQIGSYESAQGEALSNFFLVLKKKDKIHIVYESSYGKIILPSELKNKIGLATQTGIKESPTNEFTID